MLPLKQKQVIIQWFQHLNNSQHIYTTEIEKANNQLKRQIQSHFKEDLQIRPYLQELIGEADFLENRKYFELKRQRIEGIEISIPQSFIKKREETDKKETKGISSRTDGFFFDKISTSCDFSNGKERLSDSNQTVNKDKITFGDWNSTYTHTTDPDVFMRIHYRGHDEVCGYDISSDYKKEYGQRESKRVVGGHGKAY